MQGDGDGNDDDCDGQVDEDCPCSAVGLTRACFAGPPEHRGVGACADGVMACTEFLRWSDCVRGQFPSAEICDGTDNDCDGAPDEGLTGCATALTCPDTQTASPLNYHLLQGSELYAGAAISWSWTVECPPTVSPCPVPEDPTAQDTRIYFVQSGSYRIQVEIGLASGAPLRCQWMTVVRGSGLRVELAWDTQGEGRGDTDVDLHLHRRSSTTASETAFFTDDDCYYANCKATSYEETLRTRWGLPDTVELSSCNGAPHGEGDRWTLRAVCHNPRLDVDVIRCDPAVTDPSAFTFCAPENINVDDPPLGEPMRVMVNYYSAHEHVGSTHPTVSIYCGGELRGTFGSDPLVVLTDGGGFGEENQSWLVADVLFYRNGCAQTECMVTPLGQLQTGSGFGPPWSY